MQRLPKRHGSRLKESGKFYAVGISVNGPVNARLSNPLLWTAAGNSDRILTKLRN